MTTAASRIVDELRPLAVPIDTLTPYPGNAKRHDLDLIRESLRLHGQYRPAVVQASTGYVIVGNGMLAAAKAEGWTELARVVKDYDDEAARRLVLLDNRSTELGGYDTTALLALLDDLPTLETTGYTDDDLSDLIALCAPPSLDDLADAIGEPTEEDGYVSLRLHLPEAVAEMWKQARAMTGKPTTVEQDVHVIETAHAVLSAALEQ